MLTKFRHAIISPVENKYARVCTAHLTYIYIYKARRGKLQHPNSCTPWWHVPSNPCGCISCDAPVQCWFFGFPSYVEKGLKYINPLCLTKLEKGHIQGLKRIRLTRKPTQQKTQEKKKRGKEDCSRKNCHRNSYTTRLHNFRL